MTKDEWAARRQLQRYLDTTNRGEWRKKHEGIYVNEDWGMIGSAISSLLEGQPVTFNGFQTGTLKIVPTKGRLLFELDEDPGDTVNEIFKVVRLIETVGRDRIRQCALPECGYWFVANKGQVTCTLEHGQMLRDRRKAHRRRPRRARL
jgi:hypothetical protein